MNRIYIGIDPGCSGAIVVLNYRCDYLSHLLMPITKEGKSSRVNGSAVSSFLDTVKCAYAPCTITVNVERVNAMPGQGVTSMFTFGHAAGVIEGVLQAHRLSYQLITPQSWKKYAGLTGKDKDASRAKAIKLFPSLRVLDKKAQGQAIADAAFIAMYRDTKGTLL